MNTSMPKITTLWLYDYDYDCYCIALDCIGFSIVNCKGKRPFNWPVVVYACA